MALRGLLLLALLGVALGVASVRYEKVNGVWKVSSSVPAVAQKIFNALDKCPRGDQTCENFKDFVAFSAHALADCLPFDAHCLKFKKSVAQIHKAMTLDCAPEDTSCNEFNLIASTINRGIQDCDPTNELCLNWKMLIKKVNKAIQDCPPGNKRCKKFKKNTLSRINALKNGGSKLHCSHHTICPNDEECIFGKCRAIKDQLQFKKAFEGPSDI